MKRSGLMLVVVVAAGAGIVGCAGNPPITPRHEVYPTPWLTLASDDLQQNIVVDSPIKTVDPQSGIMFIEVPIRSTTNKQMIIDWRVRFTDQNGATIGEPTAWKDKVLAPRVPDRITFNATSPAARDFHLDLRMAK